MSRRGHPNDEGSGGDGPRPSREDSAAAGEAALAAEFAAYAARKVAKDSADRTVPSDNSTAAGNAPTQSSQQQIPANGLVPSSHQKVPSQHPMQGNDRHLASAHNATTSGYNSQLPGYPRPVPSNPLVVQTSPGRYPIYYHPPAASLPASALDYPAPTNDHSRSGPSLQPSVRDQGYEQLAGRAFDQLSRRGRPPKQQTGLDILSSAAALQEPIAPRRAGSDNIIIKNASNVPCSNLEVRPRESRSPSPKPTIRQNPAIQHLSEVATHADSTEDDEEVADLMGRTNFSHKTVQDYHAVGPFSDAEQARLGKRVYKLKKAFEKDTGDVRLRDELTRAIIANEKVKEERKKARGYKPRKGHPETDENLVASRIVDGIIEAANAERIVDGIPEAANAEQCVNGVLEAADAERALAITHNEQFNPWTIARAKPRRYGMDRVPPDPVDLKDFRGRIAFVLATKDEVDAEHLVGVIERFLLHKFEQKEYFKTEDWKTLREALGLRNWRTRFYLFLEDFLQSQKIKSKQGKTVTRTTPHVVFYGRGLPEEFEETNTPLDRFAFDQGGRIVQHHVIIPSGDPTYLPWYLFAHDAFVRHQQPIQTGWPGYLQDPHAPPSPIWRPTQPVRRSARLNNTDTSSESANSQVSDDGSSIEAAQDEDERLQGDLQDFSFPVKTAEEEGEDERGEQQDFEEEDQMSYGSGSNSDSVPPFVASTFQARGTGKGKGKQREDFEAPTTILESNESTAENLDVDSDSKTDIYGGSDKNTAILPPQDNQVVEFVCDLGPETATFIPRHWYEHALVYKDKLAQESYHGRSILGESLEQPARRMWPAPRIYGFGVNDEYEDEYEEEFEGEDESRGDMEQSDEEEDLDDPDLHEIHDDGEAPMEIQDRLHVVLTPTSRSMLPLRKTYATVSNTARPKIRFQSPTPRKKKRSQQHGEDAEESGYESELVIRKKPRQDSIQQDQLLSVPDMKRQASKQAYATYVANLLTISKAPSISPITPVPVTDCTTFDGSSEEQHAQEKVPETSQRRVHTPPEQLLPATGPVVSYTSPFGLSGHMTSVERKLGRQDLIHASPPKRRHDTTQDEQEASRRKYRKGADSRRTMFVGRDGRAVKEPGMLVSPQKNRSPEKPARRVMSDGKAIDEEIDKTPTDAEVVIRSREDSPVLPATEEVQPNQAAPQKIRNKYTFGEYLKAKREVDAERALKG